jgi:hypothetical protein
MARGRFRRTLVAHDVTAAATGDALELSALLAWTRAIRDRAIRDALPDPGHRIVMRVHGDAAAAVTLRHGTAPDATCLLPILTSLAAGTGSRLVVNGSVDRRALGGARQAARLMSRWWSLIDATPNATAVTDVPAQPAGRTGLFFTRGVDSTSSLVSMIRAGTPPSMLIALDWIDPPYATPDTRLLMEGTEKAASDFAIPLVKVSTNARQWLDSTLGWDRVFGATLAACGLAMGGYTDEAGIASTHPAHVRLPHGSHPDLDPLWSSSSVAVLHRHDVPGGRIDRVATMAGNPTAMAHLKVCWERAGDGNCGRCTKCLVTLANLWLADAPDSAFGRFDAPLDAESVRAIATAPRTSLTNVSEVADAFAAVARGDAPVPGHGTPETARAFATRQAEAWSLVADSLRR